MPRRFLGHLFVGIVLCVWARSGNAAGPTSMELVLQATGAAPTTFRAAQMQDDRHTCALFGPTNGEQTLVLTYNASQSQMLLQPDEFSFSLSIVGTVGAPWTEKQPLAILQVSIGKIVYFGLRAIDPAFRLEVTVGPGGETGTFVANHLRDSSNRRMIDVKGAWRCAANTPDAAQASAEAPADAEPAQPPTPAQSPHPPGIVTHRLEPSMPQAKRFRIYHSDACQGADCAIWTAVNTRTGDTFAATVILKSLNLPRPVRQQAQAGEIQLWIIGEQGKSSFDQPVITALRLDGIAPRRIESQR